MKIPRNALCPCGSGKKHKKCCLAQEQAESAEQRAAEWRDGRFSSALEKVSSWLVRNRRLLEEGDWLEEMLGVSDTERLADVLGGLPEFHVASLVGLEVDRLLNDTVVVIDGAQVAVGDLARGLKRHQETSRPPLLEADERRWFDALLATPMRLYEVFETQPGVGVTLEDPLTGDHTRVREVMGSESMEPGLTLATRVVDGGEDLPRMSMIWQLAPMLWDSALPTIRRMIRAGEPEGTIADVIREAWLRSYLYEMPDVVDMATQEPILLTSARYDVKNWDRLSAALDAEPSWPSDGERSWVWLEDPDAQISRVLARVYQDEGHSERLELFGRTASLGDRARSDLERLAGDAIKLRVIESSDPATLIKERSASNGKAKSRPKAKVLSPPVEMMQEFYESNYADFFETPLPYFGGKAPKALLSTREGRADVEDLIRDYERNEARMARSQNRLPADLGFLWRRLQELQRK